MFGIDDAILGAVAGSAISGGLSFFGQQNANKANAELSRQQMNFQDMSNTRAMDFTQRQSQDARNFAQYMSNTSWQRGVSDMKAAGINPMLAFSKGGASTPVSPSGSGSSSAGSQATMQNEFAGLSPAIANAAALSRMSADLKRINSETKLNEAQRQSTIANSLNTQESTDQLKLSKPGKQIEKEIDETYLGQLARYFNRINPFGSTAATLGKVMSRKPPTIIRKNYYSY